MAVLNITVAGRLASVCGNCGHKADTAIGAPQEDCCACPSRFKKCEIGIWADSQEWSLTLFKMSWIESDAHASPKDLWQCSMRDYVRSSLVGDPHKLALISNV